MVTITNSKPTKSGTLPNIIRNNIKVWKNIVITVQ